MVQKTVWKQVISVSNKNHVFQVRCIFISFLKNYLPQVIKSFKKIYNGLCGSFNFFFCFNYSAIGSSKTGFDVLSLIN